MAAHGFGIAEQARELGYSVETIKTRLKSARDKLGARNTTHAVALAVHRRLIQIHDPEEGTE